MSDVTSIVKLQVLVLYTGDPDGLGWPHKVLLVRIPGGKWVALTPDEELCKADLYTVRYVVLERNHNFPSDKRTAAYGFDDGQPPRADLARHLRLAKLRAAAVDSRFPRDVAGEIWVVTDPDPSQCATTLEADASNNATRGHLKGVVTLDGGLEVFVIMLGRAHLPEYVKSWQDIEDLRLLGVYRDSAGSRYLSVRDVVLMLREIRLDDWAFSGDRATKEFVTAAVDSRVTLAVYDSEWSQTRRSLGSQQTSGEKPGAWPHGGSMCLALSQAEGSAESGVSTNSMVAHFRSILVEVLRFTLKIDQIDNVSNCRSLQLITRRFIVDEMAVARCPKCPGYAGVDLIFPAPTSEQEYAVTTKFTEWMTRKRKVRRITKQLRLWVEEDRLGREKRGRGLGEGQDDDDDDDDHPGRRRATSKPMVKVKEE